MLTAEEILDRQVDDLVAEQPKLSAAATNLFCIRLGQAATDAHMVTVPRETILESARVFLKAISELELLDRTAYATANPQPESQTASDRMDQLTRYKVIHALFQKCKEPGSTMKASKVFGRSFFEGTNCFSMVRDLVMVKVKDQPDSVKDEIGAFLE
jgi:hypothetical protein